MYQVKQDTEDLDLLELGQILMSFQTKEQPKLQQYKNYYDGKQAILNRRPTDEGKIINNTVVNFCQVVADAYDGYIAGEDIQYNNIDDELIDILRYNDSKAEDSDFLKDALIYGKAFEIVYTDLWGNQAFRLLDPRNCIDIYDDTLDNTLKFVVRFWQTNLIENNQPVYTVEVYSERDCKVYSSVPGFSSFNLVEIRPNYYDQVPITVFSLNREQKSIYDQIMVLNDAYNELLSDEIGDYSQWCDSYLVLTGQIADDEQLASMKQHRVLMLDEGSRAEYLTKDIRDTAIKDMLENVENKIYTVSATVDFNNPDLDINSGIALKLRLISMENKASSIESQMKKALQKRLEILCSVLHLLNGDSNWSDVDFIFTRSIPTILQDTVDTIQALRDLVSRETLLAQLPFIDSVEEEMEKIRREREEMNPFTGLNHNDEEEEGILGRG